MAIPLLTLPSEILLQILSELSIESLLRFARTSRYARRLAYTNLQALSLTVRPSYQDSWLNKLFDTPRKPEHDLHAAIQIPRAWEFPYTTLLAFHNKLIVSILGRHACTLQKLELTLWTLPPSIAKTIATLPTLKELTIRIQGVHKVPRVYLSLQQREESKAWTSLAACLPWAHSLRKLHIENAEINTSQLLHVVENAAKLRELTLSGCAMLTSSIWETTKLGNLYNLNIFTCANVHVSQMALEAISKMHKLQVLNLHGCSGLDGEVLEQWNRDMWRVPVFVPPLPRGTLKGDSIIEVDPDYMVETT